jgi:hypothetical protein
MTRALFMLWAGIVLGNCGLAIFGFYEWHEAFAGSAVAAVTLIAARLVAPTA